jgi:PEP-CTERM motif
MNLTYKSTFTSTLLLFGCCGLIPSASASLIQSSPFEVNLNGTGFGNVGTIITLQTANGQSTTEAGCIGFGGSTTGCGIATVGMIKNSSSVQSAPAGVTDASQLRFIFNAAEPSGNGITLDALQVSFYGNSSTALYTASLGGTPLTLTSTLPGTGNSGFVFQLDATQSATVNGLWSQITGIGGGFRASNASGGQDTLFLGTGPGGGSATPEPATYALLGGGLLTVALVGRKRVVARSIS